MERSFGVTMTLGPGSEDEALIARLLGTADRFRLNSSHLEPSGLEAWLVRLSALFAREERVIPVVVDLQGAKMRLGRFPQVDVLPQRVTLFLGDASEQSDRLPVPHAELFDAVDVGERLVLNDARVELVVTGRGAGSLDAEVERNGPLASGKGVNRADHPVPVRGLMARDEAHIAVAKAFPFVQLAYSFVHTGEEAAVLRAAAPGVRLVAKLERPEAMDHLTAVDKAFDEHWFCRGDLGAQAGLANLGPLQARFVEAMHADLRKPAVLAGQVLHHMCDHPTPTRSEVVHLYDTRAAGWAGVVLSDETAIGRHPLRVAELLDELLGN